MTVERHLMLQAMILPPAAEWVPRCPGWLMARVAEGTGYWMQPGAEARQLTVGDGLLVLRNANGVVRASQLGLLKLQFFTVQPQYLNGLLTVTEWHQLEIAPRNPSPPVTLFTAGEPLGQKFARLAEQSHAERLPLRCALLQLWASAVAGWITFPDPVSGGGIRLRDHFRELVGQMTEAELSECSLSDLSRQLHCSERHFSRLFREEFGVPFRARQIELRLQRARQLLAGSHAKIINIAYDCGYRHLGLFNAMFKKRFGVTPSEWRRQNLPQNPAPPAPNHLSRNAGRTGLWLATLGMAAFLSAFAQTNLPVSSPATDGAAALQSDAVLRFDVRAYAVQGGPSLTTNTLDRIFSRYTGTNVSREEVGEAALELQSEYRNQGYPGMSIATAPEQITNGIVTMNVFYADSPQVLLSGKRYAGSGSRTPAGSNLPAGPPAWSPNAPTALAPTNAIPVYAGDETVTAGSETPGSAGSRGGEPVSSNSPPAMFVAPAVPAPGNVAPVAAIRPKATASPEELARARAALTQKMQELAEAESRSRRHVVPVSTRGPHFSVEKYLVMGNTILSPDIIGGVFTNVDGAFGTNVSFDGIRAALTDLQMAYRERGYVTVAVGLPQQKLTNAAVKVQVTEGRLARINVTGDEWHHDFSSNNVMRALPSLHTNMLLNSHVFQRELDIANANRDRQIYPVIGPGLEPGTSELALKVKDRLPWHSRVELNNAYTPNTPDLRAAFNAEYDNLWDLEHQIGLQYGFSPASIEGRHDYWFSPFDDPQIANYSGYYRMPLGHATPVQEQIEANPGRFGYNEVTHQFNMPPATGRPELTLYASRSVADSGVQHGPGKTLAENNFTNTTTGVISRTFLLNDSAGHNLTLNENLGLKLSLPLPPMGKIAATLSLGADFKRYRLTSYNTNENFFDVLIFDPRSPTPNIPISEQVFPAPEPLPTSDTALDYFPFNLGLNGSMPDQWGTTFFNAQVNFNVLPGFSGNADFANAIGTTNGAHAHYVSVQAGADRVQTIYHDWSVKLHADGQWANTRLFSNEQYALGGSAGVRGFLDGQAYGDTGWRVSIEPQTPLMNAGEVDDNTPLWIRGSVFMDYGEVYLLKGGYFAELAALHGPLLATLPGNPSRLSFWGTGFSLTANFGNHFDARLTVGIPLMDPAGRPGFSPGQNLHVYFGVGAQF